MSRQGATCVDRQQDSLGPNAEVYRKKHASFYRSVVVCAQTNRMDDDADSGPVAGHERQRARGTVVQQGWLGGAAAADNEGGGRRRRQTSRCEYNCGLQPGGSPACTAATLATFFRIAREPAQYITIHPIQNELAPIILITVLSASAYWNDADSYADRLGIMATSLLSMMALQARAPQHNGSGLRVARAPG